MSVAAILKAKGAGVETTRPDTTLHAVVWDLKLKGIGALVVTDDGVTVRGLISERDIVRASGEDCSISDERCSPIGTRSPPAISSIRMLL